MLSHKIFLCQFIKENATRLESIEQMQETRHEKTSTQLKTLFRVVVKEDKRITKFA